MNTQEAYEGIRAYFSRPGAVLATINNECDEDVCVYRTPEGDKCAVGCLIPDKLYNPSMEGQGVLTLVEDWTPIHDFFAETNTEFLLSAQNQHDFKSRDVQEFIVGLDELARQFGLEVIVS